MASPVAADSTAREFAVTRLTRSSLEPPSAFVYSSLSPAWYSSTFLAYSGDSTGIVRRTSSLIAVFATRMSFLSSLIGPCPRRE